jgi:hypothetical protein
VWLFRCQHSTQFSPLLTALYMSTASSSMSTPARCARPAGGRAPAHRAACFAQPLDSRRVQKLDRCTLCFYVHGTGGAAPLKTVHDLICLPSRLSSLPAAQRHASSSLTDQSSLLGRDPRDSESRPAGWPEEGSTCASSTRRQFGRICRGVELLRLVMGHDESAVLVPNTQWRFCALLFC